jgi:hypothetical protein
MIVNTINIYIYILIIKICIGFVENLISSLKKWLKKGNSKFKSKITNANEKI